MSERWGGSIWGKTRTELYYADSHQDLEDSYTAATRAVLRSGCNDVALDDSLEHYEYPVMALLNASTGQRRVRYDGVYNSTAKYGTPDGTPPCAVICFACARVPGKWRQYREIGGRVSVFSNVAVFFREGDLANETSPITPPRSNSDLRELTAGMLRNIIALRDFRDHGEGGRESAYLNGLQKMPGGTAALDKYLYAVERPIYDGSRVWELTGLLRKNALLDTKDLEAGQLDIQPLIDGSQALRNFAGDAPRAADDLANFVAQGKQQLARQLPK
jgi:hypothetical protein